jgi:hypothetical protein
MRFRLIKKRLLTLVLAMAALLLAVATPASANIWGPVYGFNLTHDFGAAQNPFRYDASSDATYNKYRADIQGEHNLGANTVTIYLQTPDFIYRDSAGVIRRRQTAFDRLNDVLYLAGSLNMKVIVAGNIVFDQDNWSSFKDWYDSLGRQDRWDVQEEYWRLLAPTLETHASAIQTVELADEPMMDPNTSAWYESGNIPAFTYLQVIAHADTQLAQDTLARQWINQMKEGLQHGGYDGRVGLGMLRGMQNPFRPENVGGMLNDRLPHIFPDKDEGVQAALDDANRFIYAPSGTPFPGRMIVGQTFQMRDTPEQQEEFLRCVPGQGVMGFYDGRDPGSPDFDPHNINDVLWENSLQQMIDLRNSSQHTC